jgi:hypothetical protein
MFHPKETVDRHIHGREEVDKALACSVFALLVFDELNGIALPNRSPVVDLAAQQPRLQRYGRA